MIRTFVVVAAFALAASYWCAESAHDARHWHSVVAEAERLDEDCARLQRFRAEYCQVITELIEQDLPLRKAASRIIAASQAHYPEFQTHVRSRGPSLPLEQMAADHLIQCLVFTLQHCSDSGLRETVERLQAEREEMSRSPCAQPQVAELPPRK